MSVDAEEVLRICNIYDWDGKGEIEMFYFMDIFYAMDMNLTKKTCVKFGQTDDVDKKFMKLPTLSDLSNKPSRNPNTPETTTTTLSCANCTTKNENGTMMMAELETFLTLMGDEVPK